MAFEGVGRDEVDELVAGDLFVVAGFPEVEIGDTLADPDEPEPLPRLTVDEPVLRMTFGVNTSPLAGKDGTLPHLAATCASGSTARCSATCRSGWTTPTRPTSSRSPAAASCSWPCSSSRCAARATSCRSAGPRSSPRRSTASATSRSSEASCDVPDEHVGTVTQALAPRKGRVLDLRPGDPGRTIVTFEAPARGLIGFRSPAAHRHPRHGAAAQHHARLDAVGRRPARTARAAPWWPTAPAPATGYALDNLQQRGELFVGPGEVVYEGMVVGESAAPDDMVVNAVREKEKTNIRTHCHDEARQARRRRDVHTLETAIEFIADDELVEVTPTAIRIRKRILPEQDRRRAYKRASSTRTAPGWVSGGRRGGGARSRLARSLELGHEQVVDGLRRPARRSRRACAGTPASLPTKASGARCTTSGTRSRPRPSRAASTPAASR